MLGSLPPMWHAQMLSPRLLALFWPSLDQCRDLDNEPVDEALSLSPVILFQINKYFNFLEDLES